MFKQNSSFFHVNVVNYFFKVCANNTVPSLHHRWNPSRLARLPCLHAVSSTVHTVQTGYGWKSRFGCCVPPPLSPFFKKSLWVSSAILLLPPPSSLFSFLSPHWQPSFLQSSLVSRPTPRLVSPPLPSIQATCTRCRLPPGVPQRWASDKGMWDGLS